MITSQDRQNSLLLHEIRIGRAILKSLRISYTQSRQWTSTDHVTLLKTDHFSSKSRMCALSSTVLESHGLRHLLITLTPNQNMLFIRDIASGRAIFNTLRISYTTHLQITPKHSKTLHSSSKSNPSALYSTPLESHRRRSSTNHPES